MRLENKVALVTASTRGIGLACAQRLAKEGAMVYMGARNVERAQEIAKELNAEGCQVKGYIMMRQLRIVIKQWWMKL